MILATALLACEPTPNYPVPEPPIVGQILEEQSADAPLTCRRPAQPRHG